MANVHRALVGLSEGLGSMVNLAVQRERDKAMAAREENRMRLSHLLNEESRSADRTFQSEQREGDREFQREVMEQQQTFQSEQAGLDRTFRSEESEANRREQRRQFDSQTSMQEERFRREDERAEEQRYAAQVNQIDSRLQDLMDYQVQANAEGKVIDQSYMGQLDAEIQQLQKQKQALSKQRDLMLARRGAPGYKKLSADEIRQLAMAQPTADDQATPGAAAAVADAQSAPPARQSGVPAAPEKPASMVERENYVMQRRAGYADGRQLVPQLDLSDPSAFQQQPRRAAQAPSRGQPVAFQGARDLIDAAQNVGEAVSGAARSASSAVSSRREEGPAVRQVKDAISRGESPTQEQLQALAQIDRSRLLGVYGFTESALERLGL